MEPAERLRNLMVMALADGSLAEREVNYLTDRCLQMGLGETELRDAIRFALEDGAEVKLHAGSEEAESLLTDFLRMMAADGRLTEDEKQLFAICAAKLGYSGSDVNALIDRVIGK